MEVVLIDTFVVPEESRARFLEEIKKSSAFLRTLPGFVEGWVYEKTDGTSSSNVVTTAVWKDEQAYSAARKSAVEAFDRIGFHPRQIMKELRIEMQRAVYSRSRY